MSDVTQLIANQLTSNCTNTKVEHTHLIKQLLALCGSDRRCVSSNMERMYRICDVLKDQEEPENLRFFFRQVRDLGKYLDIDNSILLKQISTSWGVPIESVLRHYAISYELNRAIRHMKTKIKRKADWHRTIQIPFVNEHILVAAQETDEEDEKGYYALVIHRYFSANEDGGPRYSSYIWALQHNLTGKSIGSAEIPFTDIEAFLINVFNDNFVIFPIIEDDTDTISLTDFEAEVKGIVDYKRVMLFEGRL